MNQPDTAPVAQPQPVQPIDYGHSPFGPPSKAARTVGIVLGLILFAAGGFGLGYYLSHDHDGPATAAATQPSGQKWTCSMHPQVLENEPGLCPICHMELVPVSDSTMSGDRLTIDPVVVQNMGVRTAEVSRGPVIASVRAVGVLEEPEPLHRDINLRVSGWIEKLYADTDGMPIKQGDPMFDLYSPELQVAVEELIAARRSMQNLSPQSDETLNRNAQVLHDTAARKLRLWGLEPKQIEELSKLEEAPRAVTFYSPMTGHVTAKEVYEGAAVNAGDRVLRLADNSTMWLEVQVHEQQLPFIQQGQRVTANVDAFPTRTFDGTVSFLHPHLDMMTRTALARITLPNEDRLLREGMYATAYVESQAEEDAVLVPREAVIDSGTRQVAFVADADGHFDVRHVKLGLPAQDGMVQILSGLEPGEQVVTSGQFLLDSESRLKEAMAKMQSPHAGHGHAPVSDGGTGSPPVSDATHRGATTQESAAHATGELDALYAEYLKLAEQLGQKKELTVPLDLNPLIHAGHAVENQALVKDVLARAHAMQGKPIEQQREQFKQLSQAFIEMLKQAPPSKSVAGQIHLMSCPMAADWLQTSAKLANPYFATTMKDCGEKKLTMALD